MKADGDISSLKIVDFGLARELSPGETVNDYCGTPGYMAPEIYKQENHRFEVDNFAFGVILFRMLSGGEKPFPATNERVLRRSTERLEYNVDSSAWEDVSQSAKQLVRKLLIAKDERLSAYEALQQEWFSNTSDTLIRTVAPGPRDTHSDALSLVSGNILGESARLFDVIISLLLCCCLPCHRQSRAPVPTDTEADRFWVNPGLEPALETLILLQVFKGRLLRDEASDSTNMMLVQEIFPHNAALLPDFISGLPVYTEAECRGLFRQLVNAVEAFHNVGVAHRYLHMNNVIVDSNVRSYFRLFAPCFAPFLIKSLCLFTS